jgi:hypothetical protein
MKEQVHQKALIALPYLVRAAQSRKTMTYKELGAKIGVHWRHVRAVAGHIRDEICRPRKLPLLNCLIVNGQSGMPGESWLPGGSKAKTKEGRRREFEEFRDRVFEYSRWDELLGQYGLSPIAATAEDLNDEARAYNRLVKARGGEAEGDEHRTLKNLIASRPEILGLTIAAEPHVEYGFLSGDEVDVAFDDRAKGWVVVEVKVGRHRGELVKGIYQAIKYRALAEAQSERKARAFLVAYDIPKEVAQLAAKHGIDTRVVQL